MHRKFNLKETLAAAVHAWGCGITSRVFQLTCTPVFLVLLLLLQVMHLLLLELIQQPCNEVLLEFMRVDEMLIDIGAFFFGMQAATLQQCYVRRSLFLQQRLGQALHSGTAKGQLLRQPACQGGDAALTPC